MCPVRLAPSSVIDHTLVTKFSELIPNPLRSRIYPRAHSLSSVETPLEAESPHAASLGTHSKKEHPDR
ncbi:predicted protein [Botrytis cinerea T4]|uniref:Uncharacterized protein n=1 Tax=Botryotinia fuckeliana (strain T4) TaxID=999810 RepID=G2XRA1_BOTF4|nr:predicted protein [Botrytis cinerea T4]